MNDTSANPVFVALLFILRCAVPLVILFGISYLLRKMGLVAVESPELPEEVDEAAVPTAGATTEADQSTGTVPNETPSVENNKES